MKIAVVGPTYPYRGGIAHYTTLLAAQLSQMHETRLYSFKQQYPDWLFPGRSQLDPSDRPLAAVDAWRWLIPWWPLSWRRVTQDWKAWLPDRLVVQWWVPFMAPMTARLVNRARRNGVRTILICHNVLPHERSQMDRILVRLALQQADQLIVHTLPQQKLAQGLLPGCSSSVVALPTYAAFQSETWNRERARVQLGLSGKKVLLFFGLVRPYKGLSDLLAALPAILTELDVTLLIVGEIWGGDAEYKAQVVRSGLEQHVQFVDRYVSNDEAAMYFAAADLAVLPYREATGSAVLQLALGLNVPVVATRTGGMDEVIEDGVTGLLVDPGDVAGLSDAVLRFFQTDLAVRFRTAIADGRDRFGWNRLIRVIER
jgi:glycosyltransferase involved in cell wall biosynthesis